MSRLADANLVAKEAVQWDFVHQLLAASSGAPGGCDERGEMGRFKRLIGEQRHAKGVPELPAPAAVAQ